jgi:hypothetical protein
MVSPSASLRAGLSNHTANQLCQRFPCCLGATKQQFFAALMEKTTALLVGVTRVWIIDHVPLMPFGVSTNPCRTALQSFKP